MTQHPEFRELKVSILLPVFNGRAYLRECLKSLLAQTFRDFEICAVDDGSADGSFEVLQEFADLDSRLRIHRFDRNSGEPAAVSHGWGTATGTYLARMDQDDVCLPERLAAQVSFLDANPAISVVGTGFEVFGLQQGYCSFPQHDAQIKANLAIGRTHICNPTSMWRRDWCAAEGIRYGTLRNVSDFGLWVDIMMANGRFANIPTHLVRYRVHSEQTSGDTESTNMGAGMIMRRLYAGLFPWLAPDALAALAAICHGEGARSHSAHTLQMAFDAYAEVSGHPLARRSVFGEDRNLLLQNISAHVDMWRNALLGSAT